MKDADKFCMISLWSFWHQTENSLLVLKIGSREHTTNDRPTFSPQNGTLKSDHLNACFQFSEPRIGSCKRALRLSILQMWLKRLIYRWPALIMKIVSFRYPSYDENILNEIQQPNSTARGKKVVQKLKSKLKKTQSCPISATRLSLCAYLVHYFTKIIIVTAIPDSSPVCFSESGFSSDSK